jgi:hypothetical protein
VHLPKGYCPTTLRFITYISTLCQGQSPCGPMGAFPTRDEVAHLRHFLKLALKGGIGSGQLRGEQLPERGVGLGSRACRSSPLPLVASPAALPVPLLSCTTPTGPSAAPPSSVASGANGSTAKRPPPSRCCKERRNAPNATGSANASTNWSNAWPKANNGSPRPCSWTGTTKRHSPPSGKRWGSASPRFTRCWTCSCPVRSPAWPHWGVGRRQQGNKPVGYWRSSMRRRAPAAAKPSSMSFTCRRRC